MGVDLRQLRRAIRLLLEEMLGANQFDLAIHIVRAPEMAQLNQKYLQHEGSTDVITFDYVEPASRIRSSRREEAHSNSGRRIGASSRRLLQDKDTPLHGEIFVCVDDAISQARQFRTTLASELVRYVIHGVLHLLGYDDVQAVARRKMKREENRLLKEMARRFPLRKIGRDPKLAR
jgi:probable rRNA maturation factor